jgi:hypothetical protein
VKEAHAKEFLELVPHADYVDVSGARHMVAGDRNDHFSAAVLSFIERLPTAAVNGAKSPGQRGGVKPGHLAI